MKNIRNCLKRNYSKQFLIPNIFKCVFIILKINNMQKNSKKNNQKNLCESLQNKILHLSL